MRMLACTQEKFSYPAHFAIVSFETPRTDTSHCGNDSGVVEAAGRPQKDLWPDD